MTIPISENTAKDTALLSGLKYISVQLFYLYGIKMATLCLAVQLLG